MHKFSPSYRPVFDYSKFAETETSKKEFQYKDFSSFISEKIKAYRKEYCDGEAHRFTRENIAKIIDIDKSTLTKIMNGTQITRKRDLIIAICFALKMNRAEIDMALSLYPMATLNPNNMRDLVITLACDNQLSINELNVELKSCGFSTLNLSRCKTNNNDSDYYYPECSIPFDEISVNICPYCIAENDANLSLHSRYRIDQYYYSGEMILSSKNDVNVCYKICLNKSYRYIIYKQSVDKWEHMYSNEPRINKRYDIQPCNDKYLLNKAKKLQYYTDQRAKYVHTICADTRNYGLRFDAFNDNSQLVIYGEIFGSDEPELCEYYQIEISSGKCIFTISEESRFMKRYLGNDEWMRLYGKQLSPVKHTYTSQKEIPNDRWRLYYQTLIESAKELLSQIKNRQLFLYNARAWISIEELMHLYKVEKAFDCIYDNTTSEIIIQTDYIIGPDGKPITVDDLYRAAELEIDSVDELCSIRKRYGSLEGFLDIDVLT